MLKITTDIQSLFYALLTEKWNLHKSLQDFHYQAPERIIMQKLLTWKAVTGVTGFRVLIAGASI